MCWLFIKPVVSSSPMSDAYSIRIHLQLVRLSAGYGGPWFIGLMLRLDSIFFWKLDPDIAFAQRCSCWWCLCLWSHGNARTVIWFSPGGKRQNACPLAWHQPFHMNAVGSAGASLWRPLTGKGDWETLWSGLGGCLLIGMEAFQYPSVYSWVQPSHYLLAAWIGLDQAHCNHGFFSGFNTGKDIFHA